jgi:hypothetical protein
MMIYRLKWLCRISFSNTFLEKLESDSMQGFTQASTTALIVGSLDSQKIVRTVYSHDLFEKYSETSEYLRLINSPVFFPIHAGI